MQITMTKADLVARLNEKRAEAEEYDAANLRKHHAEEVAYLARFKAACRAAAKFTLEEAKAAHFSIGEDFGRYNLPSCPRAKVAEYDKVLDALLLDCRARFTVRPDDALGKLVYWSATPATDRVC